MDKAFLEQHRAVLEKAGSWTFREVLVEWNGEEREGHVFVRYHQIRSSGILRATIPVLTSEPDVAGVVSAALAAAEKLYDDLLAAGLATEVIGAQRKR